MLIVILWAVQDELPDCILAHVSKFCVIEMNE